jgi:hypothetical protein
MVGLLRTWLRTNAVRKGLLGNQRGWLVVFVLGALLRLVNRARKPSPVVFRARVEPGAGLVISHLAPPETRRRRRAAR